MNKKQLLLACLAAAGGEGYEPVQIQKLVFLFQEKASGAFRRKPFGFIAYDYGPFDKAIYFELEKMEREGEARIIPRSQGLPRIYELTEEGKAKGDEVLGKLEECYRNYLLRLSAWVRSISFAQLVGAIYKEFPSMRIRSVFRD